MVRRRHPGKQVTHTLSRAVRSFVILVAFFIISSIVVFGPSEAAAFLEGLWLLFLYKIGKESTSGTGPRKVNDVLRRNDEKSGSSTLTKVLIYSFIAFFLYEYWGAIKKVRARRQFFRGPGSAKVPIEAKLTEAEKEYIRKNYKTDAARWKVIADLLKLKREGLSKGAEHDLKEMGH